MHISAKICLRALGLFPLVFESLTSGSGDFHRRQEVCNLETSRKDNHVKFLSSAALTGNARFIDFLDSLIDQTQVLLV